MSYPYHIKEFQTVVQTLDLKRRASSKSTGSSTEDDSATTELSNSADEGIAELEGPSNVPALLYILRAKEERIQALERDREQVRTH